MANDVGREIRGRNPAGGRSCTQIAERMTTLAMRHEIDSRGRGSIDEDAACVDLLAFPQCEKHSSECVVTQTRDVAGASAESRSGDRRVRRVAAEALQVRVRIVGA